MAGKVTAADKVMADALVSRCFLNKVSLPNATYSIK